MNFNPDIQWLINRWGLPPTGAAIKSVQALLDAERNGSTALRLGADDFEWGNAASVAGDTPLIVSDGYLQSHRCHHAEQIVARGILHLANSPPEGDEKTPEANVNLMAALFPDTGEGNAQVKAARTALRRRLSIITGGPGTGKTHTLARILVLLIESGTSPDFIHLAAPTGKAADRMRESIHAFLQAVSQLSEAPIGAVKQVAMRSRTLHSLLGYNFSSGRCRYNAGTPLPCEALIVDECSMMDLHLWKTLLEALPEGAKLILVGDPFQLQSVGQGNVFGDLITCAQETASPLHPSLTRLTESWRFRERTGIRDLALALEKSDAEGAEKLLLQAERTPQRGVAWLETGGQSVSYLQFPESIRRAIEAVANAETPDAAQSALRKICILTAYKGAFVGAEAVGKMIAREMLRQRDKLGSDRPPNEPVLILANDPETGLRNGSVGIIHAEADGRRRAWFGEKSLPVSALPPHTSAWAITIHRSQGGEYDDVLVFLPKEGSPLASRELLYTAITRAKKNVHIAGTMETIRAAIQAPSNRTTLLKQALNEGGENSTASSRR